MKPYHSERISMFAVCGKFCENARDVYLMYVEKRQPRRTREILLGASAHNMLEHLFTEARRGNFTPDFQVWWAKEAEGKKREFEDVGSFAPYLKSLWDFTLSQVTAAYHEARASHPFATDLDILATAVPFLVEHKLSGSLLGLSGTMSVDCYDYLRHIVFDVKVGGQRRDFYRLYPTGYALVIESLYEIPVDVGCSILVNFRDDRVIIDKDIFFISDDLRNWWLEERDRKLELIAQRRDPGKSKECPASCIFLGVCE